MCEKMFVCGQVCGTPAAQSPPPDATTHIPGTQEGRIMPRSRQRVQTQENPEDYRDK
jgi:hypothetical protein